MIFNLNGTLWCLLLALITVGVLYLALAATTILVLGQRAGASAVGLKINNSYMYEI